MNTIIRIRFHFFICTAGHRQIWIYVFFPVDIFFIILNAQSSDTYRKMDKIVIFKNTCTILTFLRRKFRIRKTHLFMYINLFMCIFSCKSKAAPLKTRTGPQSSRKLRFPDFVTTAQVVSLTHSPIYNLLMRKYFENLWKMFLLSQIKGRTKQYLTHNTQNRKQFRSTNSFRSCFDTVK